MEIPRKASQVENKEDPYNLSAYMFPHELNEYLLWVKENGDGECIIRRPAFEEGVLVTIQNNHSAC